MSDSKCDVEYAGSGSCGGAIVEAEYERTAAGWEVRYLIGGNVIADSSAPRHPSLRMLGADAAGEQRVIKTALAIIDVIEEGVYASAARQVRPAKARRKATRRATA